jgi:hypothetical protein
VNSEQEPTRPARIDETPVPSLPPVDELDSGKASVELSKHRTRLSTSRTEMSARRTGMSFQRTRMSADRTLMSVLRTSLSLIGFGFTIFQIFQKMHEPKVLPTVASLIHAGSGFPVSLTLMTAMLLLLLGLVASVSVVWQIGPLS